MWRRSVESWQAWRHETSEIVGVRRDSLRGSCSSWRRRLCGHARPICPICPICPILTNGHSRLTPRRVRSTRLQGCAHIRTRISWDLDRRRPGARRRARRHLQRQPAKCASNRSRRPGVGSGQPRAQAPSAERPEWLRRRLYIRRRRDVHAYGHPNGKRLHSHAGICPPDLNFAPDAIRLAYARRPPRDLNLQSHGHL